jgi:putative addiction module antidote
MLRKVFRTGNSLVVSLPKNALELLGIRAGADVFVELDRENRQIVITLAEESLIKAGVDKVFAQQLADFIEQYRPALEALSRS